MPEVRQVSIRILTSARERKSTTEGHLAPPHILEQSGSLSGDPQPLDIHVIDGEGIANGFAISALTGRRDVMELVGIDHAGERVFLMSSTYGSERVGLAAALATVKIIQDEQVCGGLWQASESLVPEFSQQVEQRSLSGRIRVSGLTLLPRVDFADDQGNFDPWLKTLFLQAMLSCGVLIPPYFVSFAQAHTPEDIGATLQSSEMALDVVAEAVNRDSVKQEVQGDAVRNVFRRFNRDYE